MKKTLLLNSTYESLSFVNELKVFKFILKDKVDIISNWDEYIVWGSGKMKLPSILKLKSYVKIDYLKVQFSRQSLIKRDRSMCQYCNFKLNAAEITIDHIIPRAQGGQTSFLNCVVCCKKCNNKKADKTPIQANMPLIREPIHPSFSNFCNIQDKNEFWNDEWDNYLFTSK